VKAKGLSENNQHHINYVNLSMKLARAIFFCPELGGAISGE